MTASKILFYLCLSFIIGIFFESIFKNSAGFSVDFSVFSVFNSFYLFSFVDTIVWTRERFKIVVVFTVGGVLFIVFNFGNFANADFRV